MFPSLDEKTLNTLDVAIANHNPEDVQKSLELLLSNKEKTTNKIKRELKNTIIKPEIRQILWLRFIHTIAKEKSSLDFLVTDIKIFDIYVARLGYPNIVSSEAFDEHDRLCTAVCKSDNPLVLHLLQQFFSRAQLGGKPTAPICFAYLKKAIIWRKPKLVEQLFSLYTSHHQAVIPDLAQEELFNAFVPDMFTNVNYEQQQIFIFFTQYFGTVHVEKILMQFPGQDHFRDYLSSLVPSTKNYLDELQKTDAHKTGKGCLPRDILTIILDYLIFITPIAKPAEMTDKIRKGPAIPPRLSAISASAGTNIIAPRPIRPRSNSKPLMPLPTNNL